MSEHAPSSGEKSHEHLALPTAEQAEPLRPGEVDPQARPERQKEHLKEAREEVAEAEVGNADPLDKLLEADEAANQQAPITPPNKELKQIAARRELQNIQRKLSKPSQAFSKIIHQPAIRAVSQAADQTVSRPSGLLGGGLVAFLGTTAYLYLAKHVGFSYNYAVVFLLFVGGFLVGLGLELAVYMATRSRRRTHD